MVIVALFSRLPLTGQPYCRLSCCSLCTSLMMFPFTPQITRRLLGKLQQSPGTRMSYTYDDQYAF